MSSMAWVSESMATVDILMATYNGECYVREQIRSIQAQTFKDWRLLVSDDCSTDGTLEAVRDMAGADKRIQIASERVRLGSAKANFMSLLKSASASYIMFCDQDDVWLPNKIALSLKKMQKLEDAAGSDSPLMVFTDMRVVDDMLSPIADSFEEYSSIDPSRTKLRQLIAQSVGAGCTTLINKSAAFKAARLNDAENIVMHDWWVFLVCAAFGNIAYLDESTSLYRQHGDNAVGATAYSPIKKALNFTGMQKSVKDTARQAKLFDRIYKDELSDAQRDLIAHYIQSCETRGLRSVYHLAASGCWKKGLRKIGQIAVALRGSNR